MPPGSPRSSRRRRSSAKGVSKLVQQALGLEAKLRQYSAGRNFVQAVDSAGGAQLFARVWRSPGALPTMEEISAPEKWIARVGGVAALSA